MPRGDAGAKRKPTSIDIALNILELFSPETRELGISEIASRLRKKASTIHRTLGILKNRGYVEQSAERGKYSLGLRVFELGTVYQNQSNFMRDAMACLESLSRATDETINLAVLDQDLRGIAYIAKIESPHILKTDIRIGTRLYSHCTALGKVLLSQVDDAALDEAFPSHADLPGYTKRSITNTDQLRAALADVRKKGYAIDEEEFRSEVVCVAMPFRDMNRRTVAAISVTAPAHRFTRARVEEITKIMFGILGPSGKDS
jgi:DNA-binding IclR family transcriptional regulator